eukprot:gnl/Spiro4/23803_TR11773_c0_g1_i1.p1 gnl/Spiro4/23803_TR11773_c0_g1~~gnl/Spiro4/23803_TR11773_c0_g1_i1.p1  ORF type:complete len:299 (+),score=88.40 gnl/Spiro4/23803_TR11773_c0_g1_i1:88-984(+)
MLASAATTRRVCAEVLSWRRGLSGAVPSETPLCTRQIETFDPSSLATVCMGKLGFLHFRTFVMDAATRRIISPWHHLPLVWRAGFATGAHAGDVTYTFVNEIPKGSRHKLETATAEPFNPIKQDVKAGALRFYKYGDTIFNYGCLPRTWDSPLEHHPSTGAPGDNDPIDVIEIGRKPLAVGEVVEVRVLGVLALVDQDETDWKILAINTKDERASTLFDVTDVPAPERAALQVWFRDYKLAEGKSANRFAFNGEFQNKAFAEDVIEHAHTLYDTLVRKPPLGCGFWLPPDESSPATAT